jgi:hypothetical protein
MSDRWAAASGSQGRSNPRVRDWPTIAVRPHDDVEFDTGGHEQRHGVRHPGVAGDGGRAREGQAGFVGDDREHDVTGQGGNGARAGGVGDMPWLLDLPALDRGMFDVPRIQREPTDRGAVGGSLHAHVDPRRWLDGQGHVRRSPTDSGSFAQQAGRAAVGLDQHDVLRAVDRGREDSETTTFVRADDLANSREDRARGVRRRPRRDPVAGDGTTRGVDDAAGDAGQSPDLEIDEDLGRRGFEHPRRVPGDSLAMHVRQGAGTAWNRLWQREQTERIGLGLARGRTLEVDASPRDREPVLVVHPSVDAGHCVARGVGVRSRCNLVRGWRS